MDLSELTLTPVPSGRRPTPTAPAIDPHQLVAQIGSEVASALSAALERVNTLAATGKIDRAGLRALREEIDLARRIGIMGQQVSRLADGRVKLARERLSLTNLLREALRQRGREIEARGLDVRQVLAPAEVMSDATLLFALLQTVLDWSFEHAVARVELTIEIRNWPAVARLACAFAHQPPDEVDADAPAREAAARLDTMSWRLLQQTGAVLGLRLARHDAGGRTELAIEFPETLAARVEGLEPLEFEETSSQALNSKPLAGRHVLVVASRRETRNVARAALRPMGMMIDFVTSVAEAEEFCRGALPHAIVYEAPLAGERFERLRGEALAAVPHLAFIEIADDTQGFEVLNLAGRQFARVGRESLLDSLPAALGYELTRLSAGG